VLDIKEKRNVLVVGGAGFIGSHTVEGLIERGYEVLVFDNLSTGSLKNLESVKDKITFINGDVNDYKQISAVFQENSFNYVFAYAAVVGVQRTLTDPINVLNDIEGIKNILRLSKANKIKQIFFSSSSEVYGEQIHFPLHEEHTPLNSRLPYAVVKNLGEVYLKAYQKHHGLNFTIFRFFNTYGPRQSEDFVITKFIKQALKNEDIEIYGEGNQTRTFLYVKDNVEACLNAMGNKAAMNNVINIGGPEEITISQLAAKIKALTESSAEIRKVAPLEEGDMQRRKPAVEKMKSVLFGKEPISIEEGVRKTIDYFKSKN